ncbi:MAG: acylphosphatase [Nitrososphaerota archaeon]
MSNVRVHVFVSGLVQGVFYRQNAKRVADSLGLRGWIRNLRDGRVEAVIEGPEERVREMVEWMKKGPPMARVERVEVVREKYVEEYRDFRIVY